MILRHEGTTPRMRLRLRAPRGQWAPVGFLDSVHGALVNSWKTAGARGDDVVGPGAGNWSFGAVGRRTPAGLGLRSVVIGAEGPPLEPLLPRLDPAAARKTSVNGDRLDLSNWTFSIEELPAVGEDDEMVHLPFILLSPLAISARGRPGRWHDDLRAIGPDLDGAVNSRLSRLTGRQVDLRIEPDRLYLRANPRHSVLVRTRSVRGGRPAFVVGMMAPLVISGRRADLESAWTLGIGEKNRYGFGCLGLAGMRA